MIERIKNHKVLGQYAEEDCCENDICVTFEDDVNQDSYVILKVDKFYNSLRIEKRPASVDCLIIRKCASSGYGLTLVELKNIDNSKGFSSKNLTDKFKTTLYDFIKKRFKNPLDANYTDVKLFFVSNKEIYKRDIGLKLETIMNVRFKFNNKTLMINPKMPNPTIKRCY